MNNSQNWPSYHLGYSYNNYLSNTGNSKDYNRNDNMDCNSTNYNNTDYNRNKMVVTMVSNTMENELLHRYNYFPNNQNWKKYNKVQPIYGRLLLQHYRMDHQ